MIGSKVGLHVIQYPSGRFGYVGSVPASCCNRVQANRSAVLGCRAVREGEELVEYVPMAFDTQQEAIDHAIMCGFEAKLPITV